MNCQHKDCKRTVVVECFKPGIAALPENFAQLDAVTQKKLMKDQVEYYCPEHCQAHGYCWNCGFYQSDPAGLDEEGLCANCREKVQ